MRLYGIKREEIEETLRLPDRQEELCGTKVAYKNFPGRFSDLPLKVVYVVEEEAVIITAYPLKRGYRRYL